MQLMKAESSYPTTETSAGTDRPERRAARIAPSASGSLAQTMPVTPRAISRAAAAWPPSSEKRVRSTRSGSTALPVARKAVSSKATNLRRDGT